MNIRHHHRAGAGFAALALVLAACGGDDDSAGADVAEPIATVAPVDTEPAATAAPADDGAATDPPAGDVEAPTATIPPDLPEEFVGVVGPVDVIGTPLPSLVADGADTGIGASAPALVGVDYEGTPVRLDAAADGPTLVVFLAHWCPHCNDEIPVLNELRDDGRFPEGLNIVAVSTAVNPDQPNFPPGEWLVDKDWTYPVIADGVDMVARSFIAADAFGVSGFPFIALLDGDGVLVDRWSGQREPDEILAAISSGLGL